jgi:ABC-type branched-subunit amino acid transport system ATPase component
LFQGIRPFNRLSVLQNVAVGAKNQLGEGCLNVLFRPFRVSIQEDTIQTGAMELLEFVGLADKGHLFADQLSYGQQKLMAIARLLAGDAKILLLDEPTSGVHPCMIDKLLGLIQSLADEGRTVVMVEHNLNVVRSIGDWVYLMAQGSVEVFGEPREVLSNQVLLELFPTL